MMCKEIRQYIIEHLESFSHDKRHNERDRIQMQYIAELIRANIDDFTYDRLSTDWYVGLVNKARKEVTK